MRSVRGMTGQWMPERPIPGYYTAYFEFADGHAGDDRAQRLRLFHGTANCFRARSTATRYTEADRVALRTEMRTGKRDEEREKEKFRIGGSNDPTKNKDEGGIVRGVIPTSA